MLNKNYIPKWLLSILIILILLSLILYYLISNSPRIEDLLINLSATLLGIVATLFIIDRIIKNNERKEWKEFEGIISNRIIDIIFTLCNYLNISSVLWEGWLRIFKEDIDKKNKIIQYVTFFKSSKIDIDYIKKIITENHLMEFFTNGYKGTLQNLDDTYRLYSHKLTADQSTSIINLKMKVSILINDMSGFHTTNFAIKEFNVQLDTSLLSDFKENVNMTILAADKLLKTI